jgi:hypothetical protein
MPRIVKRSASQAVKAGPSRRGVPLPQFVPPQLSDRSRIHCQALICRPLRTEEVGRHFLVLLSSTSPRTDAATTGFSFRLTWLLCCEIHEIGISTYKIGAQMLQVDFQSWSYNSAAIHRFAFRHDVVAAPRGARWN